MGTVATMAAEHGLVSAEEWFSGGERLPYDPERARFDHGSPLRVFVRHASGTGTTLTFLPGWPDGSFGWAKVDAQLAERSDADRLFLDYVGHGDSDKPPEYPYSTYERADLVVVGRPHRNQVEARLGGQECASSISRPWSRSMA